MKKTAKKATPKEEANVFVNLAGQHFEAAQGRLGVTVVLMPSHRVIRKSRGSEFEVQAQWISADEFRERLMMTDIFSKDDLQRRLADFDAVASTIDPTSDMVLYLLRACSTCDCDGFDGDALLLIRNGRDEQSVPMPVSIESVLH